MADDLGNCGAELIFKCLAMVLGYFLYATHAGIFINPLHLDIQPIPNSRYGYAGILRDKTLGNKKIQIPIDDKHIYPFRR